MKMSSNEVSEEINNCRICFEPLNNEILKLSCNHVFHNNCIQLWFSTKRECPICRRTIDTESLLNSRRSLAVPPQTHSSNSPNRAVVNREFTNSFLPAI